MTSILHPESSPAVASNQSPATNSPPQLLQRAISEYPALLRYALAESGLLKTDETVEWRSPIADKEYREYQDMLAIRHLRGPSPLYRPLNDFWPPRGPLWNGLGITTGEVRLLVEASTHLREGGMPEVYSTPEAINKVQSSLSAARAAFAPESEADWSGEHFQYASRLAFQLFLSRDNRMDSRLVFLHFTHTGNGQAPETIDDCQAAIAHIHAALGLPEDLTSFGVHQAYLDARRLPA